MSLSHHDRLLVKAMQSSIPLDVSIELTHHCNFRCEHCYIPDFLAPDRLSTERLLSLLEELAEMGTMFLTLTGGELFLRRDWLPVAQRARQLGFGLRLFSNGTLIDQAAADAIAALPAVVEISLYSMNRLTFETVTQREGSFNKTLRGIKILRKCGVEVVLKMPLMTHNHKEIEGVAKYAESVGADFQVSSTILAKKDGDLAPLALRVSHEELLPLYGGPHLGCGLPDQESGGLAEDDPRKDGPLCAAASRYCNITSAGDVMACNVLPGAGGNIRDRSFRDVWENSEWLNEVRSIRVADLHTCKSCSSLSYCGRCHAQALTEDGDLYGPSAFAQGRAEALQRKVAGPALVQIGASTAGEQNVPPTLPESWSL